MVPSHVGQTWATCTQGTLPEQVSVYHKRGVDRVPRSPFSARVCEIRMGRAPCSELCELQYWQSRVGWPHTATPPCTSNNFSCFFRHQRVPGPQWPLLAYVQRHQDRLLLLVPPWVRVGWRQEELQRWVLGTPGMPGNPPHAASTRPARFICRSRRAAWGVLSCKLIALCVSCLTLCLVVGTNLALTLRKSALSFSPWRSVALVNLSCQWNGWVGDRVRVLLQTLTSAASLACAARRVSTPREASNALASTNMSWITPAGDAKSKVTKRCSLSSPSFLRQVQYTCTAHLLYPDIFTAQLAKQQFTCTN